MLSFGLNELKEIVELGGRELEREDRYIAGCFARNAAYSVRSPDWFPGIMYMKYELYFQRVIARALLPSFPFRAQLEVRDADERADLVLYHGNPAERVAVGEMKVAMEKGDISKDAALVRPDIEKLKPLACGQFILLFTLNDRRNTDCWIHQLKGELGILPACELPRYIFPTEAHWANDPERDREFGVVGVLLKECRGSG